MKDRVHRISEQKKKELEERLSWLETVEKERVNNLMADNKFYESSRKFAAAVAEKNAYQKEVREVTEILNNCEIIDESQIDKSKVGIGVTVVLEDDEGNVLEYKIVSPVEVDPSQKMISLESPLGVILDGKEKGTEAPFCDKVFRIVDIV